MLCKSIIPGLLKDRLAEKGMGLADFGAFLQKEASCSSSGLESAVEGQLESE